MDKFIYVRKNEDDAYLNSVANFKGMAQTSSASITLYFDAAAGAAGNNGGFDEIVLAVTDTKEKTTMEGIASIMGGAKNGGTVVIADKFLSKYYGDVTDVTSITKNTAGNAITKIEAITPAGDGTGASDNANTRQLEAADSGKIFLINMSANTAAFRLPAVSGNTGVNYGFIMDVTSDAEDTKDFILSTDANGENIMGVVQDAGAIHDIPPTTSVISLDASAGNVGAGDRLFCVCDGTNWYITEANALSANAWVPADNAI